MLSKDKIQIIELLNESLKNDAVESGNDFYYLELILDCLKASNVTINEKNDWINKGVSKVLLGVICRNAVNNISNELPIEICNCLVNSNGVGSKLFYSVIMKYLEEHTTNTACMLELLVSLVAIDPFRTIFVQEYGVSRILDTYIALSRSESDKYKYGNNSNTTSTNSNQSTGNFINNISNTQIEENNNNRETPNLVITETPSTTKRNNELNGTPILRNESGSFYESDNLSSGLHTPTSNNSSSQSLHIYSDTSHIYDYNDTSSTNSDSPEKTTSISIPKLSLNVPPLNLPQKRNSLMKLTRSSRRLSSMDRDNVNTRQSYNGMFVILIFSL